LFFAFNYHFLKQLLVVSLIGMIVFDTEAKMCI